MDIGSKLKDARTKAGLTQEIAAEKLYVSRQTISNWENGKTYPDIISTIKMSDLYNISLDSLLKGEDNMSNYIKYLEDSTNTVKSRNNLSKLLNLLAYMVIWSFAIITFYFFTDPGDAMGYSLMFMWLILPITTIVCSCIMGRCNHFGNKKWFFTLFFGFMYMASGYATFDMANMITFNKFNIPDFSLLAIGFVLSVISMLIGYLVYKKKSTRKKLNK